MQASKIYLIKQNKTQLGLATLIIIKTNLRDAVTKIGGGVQPNPNWEKLWLKLDN